MLRWCLRALGEAALSPSLSLPPAWSIAEACDVSACGGGGIEGSSWKSLSSLLRDLPEGRGSPARGKALLGKKAGDRVHIQVNETYGYDVVVRGIEKAADDGSIPLNSF